MKTYHFFRILPHTKVTPSLVKICQEKDSLQIYGHNDQNRDYVEKSSSSYIESIVSTMKDQNWPIDEFLYKYKYKNNTQPYHDPNYEKILKELLKTVRVFLVHTDDSGIEVKEFGEDIINVPADKCASLDTTLSDIDRYIQDTENKEFPGLSDEQKGNGEQGITISDFLGVYIYDSKPTDGLKHKIFIWIDKVEKEANSDKDNTEALFELVLFHELAHALMDVHLYGLPHTLKFTYSKDYTYRIIEETLADCFALLAGSKRRNDSQMSFLMNYLEPWSLLLCGTKDPLKVMRHWMLIKHNFNSMPPIFLKRLRNLWKNKDFTKLY